MEENWKRDEIVIKGSFGGQAVPNKHHILKGKKQFLLSEDIIVNVFLLEWKNNEV